MLVEKRLQELGLSLPKQGPSAGNYVRTLHTGNYIYLSGHLPNYPGGKVYKGKVGRDIPVEEGYQGARQAALCMLSSLKDEIGNLDKVVRVVKVTGFVSCAEDFLDQSKVVNGASDLFLDVFGERGRHARSAVGVFQLPTGAPVEVDAIFEVGD